MQQFLDKTGFVRAWQHIKAYIDKKARDNLEIGETLVEKDGVIDVKTPVHGIISQQDFDALPPEKQKQGMYVIPGTGGGVGGTSQEIYSTEETKIGTWIDGRPIYRKVFQCYTPSGVNAWHNISDNLDDMNIKTVVNIHGILHDETGNQSFAKFRSLSDMTFALGTSHTTCISMLINDKYFLNKPVHVILEYTKTTDEGSTT